jgi:hypothetical protein
MGPRCVWTAGRAGEMLRELKAGVADGRGGHAHGGGRCPHAPGSDGSERVRVRRWTTMKTHPNAQKGGLV